MPRPTLPETLQMLRDLAAKEVVFKVEVDDAKYYVGQAYDAARNKLRETYTYAGRWEALSTAENAIDLPYSLVHLFGKKFLKSIETAKAELKGTTPYIDAIGHMVSELSPLNTIMQGLITRQVKGRRPVESNKVVIGTRTQLRAICPCCFREQAVNGVFMVSHGYTLQHNFQQGICSGFNTQHFGTEIGRDIAAASARGLDKQADLNDAVVARLRAGDPSVAVYDGKGKLIVLPTTRQQQDAAYRIEGHARSQRQHAQFLMKMVAGWTPQEPREVKIDITE